MDRDFYDLEDPGLLKRFAHRIKVGAKLVAEYLEKIKLQALLLFDEKRVLLDGALPEVKHDWAMAHEAAHQLIPWHREFCRGDTVHTLDPEWHEEIEAEANFAASALLVCGDVFSAEARELTPGWPAIETLRRRYKKSLTVVARRYVRHGSNIPILLLVSTAAWDPRPKDQSTRVRHIVTSPAFESRFPMVAPEELRGLVDAGTEQRRGGPVGEFHCWLRDRDGQVHVFHAECFYNGYYVMSLFIEEGGAASLIAVPDSSMRAKRGE